MCVQAKYECAVKHSDTVKIITPDWLIDSINIGKTLDEQDYHPSKLTRKGSNHVTKEGSSTPNTEVNVDQSSMSNPLSSLVVKTTEIQVVLPEIVHSSGKKDDEVVQPVPKEETSTQDAQTCPKEASPEGMSCTQSPPAAEAQLQSTIKQVSSVRNESNNVNTAQQTDKTVVTHGTVVHSEQRTSVTEITPPTNSETQAEESITVTPMQVEHDPSSVLLRGVVVCFSDYQECMDDETVDKWKQVTMCLQCLLQRCVFDWEGGVDL